ncbi:hypothetical protein AZI87_14870 [Bdellovibrio bacteriovorus]|uniref:Uncharacterized protein n=1 Tax=Bdellovibrio bacteriovorus TaxID=959 RepID=A0A162FVV2_BDEBC|nr:hypothetical protein AZI87_14870 [Bdellovibrio bacteriovorus]
MAPIASCGTRPCSSPPPVRAVRASCAGEGRTSRLVPKLPPPPCHRKSVLEFLFLSLKENPGICFEFGRFFVE